MPHFIITEAKRDAVGELSECRVHPIMGGNESVPTYREDGGVWKSAADVVAMIENKDAVFALTKRDGQRVAPERVQVTFGRLHCEALTRLAK